MKEEMRQAEKLPRVLGDQSLHGLVSIEETRPSHVRNHERQRRFICPAIERVVTVPQRFPLRKIERLDCSYQDLSVPLDSI
jgi:hypothetical protein